MRNLYLSDIAAAAAAGDDDDDVRACVRVPTGVQARTCACVSNRFQIRHNPVPLRELCTRAANLTRAQQLPQQTILRPYSIRRSAPRSTPSSHPATHMIILPNQPNPDKGSGGQIRRPHPRQLD